MVGGTGLYIKAFCEGLDEIPSVDESIRRKIIGNYETWGLSWLQNEIKEKDPGFFKTGEMQNPQRIMRALEVVESTGQSIIDFRSGKKAQRDFNIIKLGLELPKQDLHNNINSRVDKMIERGLVEEVRSLLPFRRMGALQTVGYTEIFDCLDGKISMQAAMDEISQHTRQYAKRQMTWFRKDKEIKWFSPDQVKEILGYLLGMVSKN